MSDARDRPHPQTLRDVLPHDQQRSSTIGDLRKLLPAVKVRPEKRRLEAS